MTAEIVLPKGIVAGEHPPLISEKARMLRIRPEEVVIDVSISSDQKFFVLVCQLHSFEEVPFHMEPLQFYYSALTAIRAADKHNLHPEIVLPSVLDSWPPRRREAGVIARYFPYTIEGKFIQKSPELDIKPLRGWKQLKLF